MFDFKNVHFYVKDINDLIQNMYYELFKYF